MRRAIKPGPGQTQLFKMPRVKPKPLTDTSNKLILFYKNFLKQTILHYMKMTDNQLKALRQNPKPQHLMPMWFSVMKKLEQKNIVPRPKQIDEPARFVRTRTFTQKEQKYAKRVLFNCQCIKILKDLQDSVENHNLWELEQKEKLLVKQSKMNNPQWTIYSKIMAEKERGGLEYIFTMP